MAVDAGRSKSDSVLYSGYLPLKDSRNYDQAKRPQVQEWENPSTWYDLASVQNGAGYAGVLSEQAYIIDIDVEEQAQKVLEIIKAEQVDCEVRKTTRGIHIAFIRGSRLDTGKHNGWCTVIGLGSENGKGKTDYLAPDNGKRAYQSLKVQGKERPIVYKTKKLGTCPAWLQPITGTTKQRADRIAEASSFEDAGDGDGRNDKLFRWMKELKIMGFTRDEGLEVARVINEYVFAIPLEADEFETVTRQEAWDNINTRGRPKVAKVTVSSDGKIPFPVNESNKPAYDVVARELIEEFHIKRIFGSIHVYRDGVYVLPESAGGGNLLFNTMENRYYGLGRNTCLEVMGSIERQFYGSIEPAEPRYIAFKNGIYDVYSNQLLDFDPDIVITNQIPWDYVKGAKSEVLDNFLDSISVNDREIRQLLEEVCGYCFYRKAIYRKAIFLTGDGCNGKSTFISLMRDVLGLGNWCNIDPKYMDTDVNRFKLKDMFCKLANLADDISDSYIKDTSNFKKAVTGDVISVEGKGTESVNITPYATQVFSVNTMPRSKDPSGAMTSRILMVPFDATFTTPDPMMKDKLSQVEVIQAMIYAGTQALRNMLSNNGFIVPEKCKKALEEFKLENDSVKQFLTWYEETGQQIWNNTPANVHRDYKTYCDYTAGIMPLSLVQFGKQLRKAAKATTKTKRIGMETAKIYVPIDG